MSVLSFVKHRVIAGVRDEGGILPATRKAVSLLAGGGLRTLVLGDSYVPGVTYWEWIEHLDSLSEDDRSCIAHEIAEISDPPTFSVLVPTFNPPLEMLRAAVESVERQLYPHWELCIADDASTDPAVRKFLEGQTGDSRIKIVLRDVNGHISAATNSALDVAAGDWIVTLDHDDVLAEDALYRCAVEIIDQPRIRMIYSDEDKLDAKGRRVRPYFKPGFNRELLRSNNYICHLACYRRDEVLEIGGFREGFEGSQDHDLALRYTERLRRDEIVHIPRVLYHWREHAGSTALGIGVKTYALEAGVRAIEEHLSRVGLSGSVAANTRGYYQVQYTLPDKLPTVTIIIPTKNSLQLLSKCIESIRTRTTYASYSILVIDNGSTEAEMIEWLREQSESGNLSVLRDEGPFNFAGLNNRGVESVQSDYVLLLNNDTEVISPDWLSSMVAAAEQPDVGAVGAKLLYSDDSVQHCGVVTGIGGSAGHAFKGHPRAGLGYYFRAAVRSEFSAVTGACLLVRRELYRSAGGLDEKRLRVAFNDIDFCLRLHSQGYRNIVCPDALLYHYESKTRGYEDTPEKAARFAAERACFRQRWMSYIENDPAYNVNLTRDDEHFSHERRFSPHAVRDRVAGDDDFDALASARVSPALILLLKRLCAPTERSVGIVIVGKDAASLAVSLAEMRPSLRLSIIDTLASGTAAEVPVAVRDSDGDPGVECRNGTDEEELPYPVDLLIQLDSDAPLSPALKDRIDGLRDTGTLVYHERDFEGRDQSAPEGNDE